VTQLAMGWVLATEAATEPSSSSLLGWLLPLVVLGGFFYFVMVMPQRRRMRAMNEMREGLEIGDEIRTIGGIRGVIQDMDDDEITLDIGGTTIRLVARAIAERLGEDT